MATVRIKVSEIVGGGICVAAADGQKLHAAIYDALTAGHIVEISFENVTRLTTAFLNAAIGQLYGEFGQDELRQRLAPPVNSEPWQMNRLMLVIQRARSFFQDQDKMVRQTEEITGLKA